MSETKVILLAEDIDDDVVLIKRAFKHAGISNPIQVVSDGEEVIQYLSGEGKYAARSEYPLPSLLLLDLKMPKMDGFEVLKWIRSQPCMSNVIVVVLTSSQEMRDVNRAYQLGANSFLVKPMDFQNAKSLIELVRDYWLMTNREPQNSRPPIQQPKGTTN